MDKTYCLKCGRPAKTLDLPDGPRCRCCLGNDFYYGSEEKFLVYKAKMSKDDHIELTKDIIGQNMEVDFN